MDATLAPGGSICVGVTVRFNPGEYHWLLWLLDEDGSNGTCAHAVDRTGAFQFEKKLCKAGGPDALSVLVRVGSLGNRTVAGLVTILEQIPIASPVGTDDENVRFTCRIWVREAIRVLHRHGILVCDDVNALERELVRLGDENRESVETGMGKPLYYLSGVYVDATKKKT